MSMIYTFVTGTPYVAIDVLGISPARLGLLLFFPAVASFAGFLVAARVVNRVGGSRLMRTGALLAFAGAASMAVLSLAGVWHPLALFIPGMLIGFANALATPSSTTAAITRHPAIAGAASGLLGFVHLVRRRRHDAAGRNPRQSLAGAAGGHADGAVPGELCWRCARSRGCPLRPGRNSPPELPEPTR